MNLTRYFSTILALSTLVLSPLAAAPSNVQFRGKASFKSKAAMEDFMGTAPASGTVSFDPDNPTAVSGSILVSVAAINTGNSTRNEHLRSSDWLDADKCPNLSFTFNGGELTSKKTNDKGVTTYKMKVTGNFGAHCVEQEITTVVKIKVKGSKIKAKSKFTVTLANHKIEGAQGLVGSKVAAIIKANVKLTGKL